MTDYKLPATIDGNNGEVKAVDNFQICPDTIPTKPSKAPFVGFDGSLNGQNENIYAVPAANDNSPAPMFDAPLTPADLARHDRVLKMLDDNPEIYRAITADDLPDHSIMTVALRGVAVVAIELPPDYDRFALLALIELHGQATH